MAIAGSGDSLAQPPRPSRTRREARIECGERVEEDQPPFGFDLFEVIVDRRDRITAVLESPTAHGSEPGRPDATVGREEVDQIGARQVPDQLRGGLARDPQATPEFVRVEVGSFGEVLQDLVLRVRDGEFLERLVQQGLKPPREAT